MRKVKMSKVKFSVLAVCAVAAVAFALSPIQARADEINLAGSTTGFFNGTPGLTSLNSGGLTFTNDAYFNNTTVGGTAALVLGSFFLSASPVYYNYGGNSFTLDVNFTSPPGSGSVNSTAQVQGSVSLNNGGVWIVNWSQPDLTVDFTNSYGNPDSFALALNSVSLAPNSSALLTGFVSYTAPPGGGSSTVPEPPTVALAGLGIAGLFLLKKRLLLA